jgi:hypothetical protein
MIVLWRREPLVAIDVREIVSGADSLFDRLPNLEGLPFGTLRGRGPKEPKH